MLILAQNDLRLSRVMFDLKEAYCHAKHVNMDGSSTTYRNPYGLNPDSDVDYEENSRLYDEATQQLDREFCEWKEALQQTRDAQQRLRQRFHAMLFLCFGMLLSIATTTIVVSCWRSAPTLASLAS